MSGAGAFLQRKAKEILYNGNNYFLEEKANTLPLIIISKSNALGAAWEGVREEGRRERR